MAPRRIELVEYPGHARIEFAEKGHRYTVNGEVLPSVTQILGMVAKPALPWWGMKVGIAGALELIRTGDIDGTTAVDQVVDLLTRRRLTVNHVTEEAQGRGTDVHTAAERFAKAGQFTSVDEYDEVVRPYLPGLAAFLLDARPHFLQSEVLVASLAHRYAGRYDWRAALTGRCELVVDATTGERKWFDPGIYLGDYKTGKAIYDEASWQLAGYEGASLECGLNPTDGRLVVLLTDTGQYEVASTWSEPELFQSLAASWHQLDKDKQNKRAA